LAAALGVSWEQLRFLLYRAKARQRYASFVLKKKSGGAPRIIHAPTGALKTLQRRTAIMLAKVYSPKASTHGFVSGKSVVSNARAHLRRRLVFNIDLKDFFPSIHIGRVIGLLQKEPYLIPKPIAIVMAQICCHNAKLPQGAPTSPLISNMICARMDGELARLARSHGAFYTRYADDITFSTNREILPAVFGQVIDSARGVVDLSGCQLEKIISSNGFVVNQQKVRLASGNQTRLVTGVKVNSIPNVRRTYVRNIRAMLDDWRRHGYTEAEKTHNEIRGLTGNTRAEFRRVVHGKISYLKMVKGEHDPVWAKFYRSGQDLERRDIDSGAIVEKSRLFAAHPSKVPAAFRHLERAVWVVENSNSEQGTAFAISDSTLLTCAHCIGPETFLVDPADHKKRYLLAELGRDEKCDVALLHVPHGEIKLTALPFALGHSDIDSIVTVVGFPDFAPGASVSIVRGRKTSEQFRFGYPVFMVDCSIYSGNSGGPVFNEKNQVIGIAARGSKPHATDRGDQMSWVIPLSSVAAFLPDK